MASLNCPISLLLEETEKKFLVLVRRAAYELLCHLVLQIWRETREWLSFSWGEGIFMGISFRRTFSRSLGLPWEPVRPACPRCEVKFRHSWSDTPTFSLTIFLFFFPNYFFQRELKRSLIETFRSFLVPLKLDACIQLIQVSPNFISVNGSGTADTIVLK
jgi:hypothetical protein